MKRNRTLASAIMWLTYLIMVGLSLQTLGAWAILLAFVLMMPLLGAMGIMWNNDNISVETSPRGFIIETEDEKHKGIPIDSVLNDFSNDDLKMLRERLIREGIDDDIYYDYGFDDSESLLEEH